MLGQVVETRLRGAVDPTSVEPPGADRGDRLRHVVGRAGGIEVGVREAGEPLLLVGLEQFHTHLRQQREHRDDRRQPDHGEREQVRPARPGHEEARAQRRDVDERRAEVGLLEDEQDRDGGEPDRAEHDARLVETAHAVGEEAGQREDEQELAELGGLELERAELDPALRAPGLVAEREDEQHQHDRRGEDRLLRTPEAVRVDCEDEEQPGKAEPDRDRLPHDVVQLVAPDIVARDAGDAPEAVGDQRGDGAEEHPVETAQEGEHGGLLARKGAAGGVVEHQSEGTSATTVAFTP